jgi:hypothetical protein
MLNIKFITSCTGGLKVLGELDKKTKEIQSEDYWVLYRFPEKQEKNHPDQMGDWVESLIEDLYRLETETNTIHIMSWSEMIYLRLRNLHYKEVISLTTEILDYPDEETGELIWRTSNIEPSGEIDYWPEDPKSVYLYGPRLFSFNYEEVKEMRVNQQNKKLKS